MAAVSNTDASYLNTSSAASTSTTKTKPAGGTLGKDEFLQLLVMQMQYQDPLEPQDNGEYIAQLAQFSALEQMTNLNSSMGNLMTVIDTMGTNAAVSQASSLIGKEITWDVNANWSALGVEVPDGIATSYKSSSVKSVTLNGGVPFLVMEDDTIVSLSAVTDIAEKGASDSTTSGS